MNEVVTSPASAIPSFYSSAPESPFAAKQTKQSTRVDRSQNHSLNDESSELGSHLTSEGTTPPPRRPSAGLQKPSYNPSPLMLSRTSPSDLASVTELSPHASDRTAVPANSSRWKVVGSGQLVDLEGNGAWDITEDMVKLQIGDGIQDTDGRIPSPTQSKRTSNVVVHVQETSPLDTSSSDASLGSISPPNDAALLLPGHSRGSSTDTHTSEESSASHAVQPLKITTDAKDRPHSFSGGLSTAELRRLQQAGDNGAGRFGDASSQQQDWAPSIGRDSTGGDMQPFPSTEQPIYPSLTNYPTLLPRPQQSQAHSFAPSGYDFRALAPGQTQRNDAVQIDYNMQPRSLPPHQQAPQVPASFVPSAVRHSVDNNTAYRQAPRGMFNPALMQTPAGMLPNANFPYGNPHLSLGNSQQLYDMMMPAHQDPVLSRAAQHGAFRASHQHSASDPATLRDAATLALLNGAAFPTPVGPGMYPPPPALAMYPNQFYPTPAQRDAYVQEVAQAMTRLQPQYTGMSNGYDSNIPSNSNGPSVNNRKLGLYKTELCRSWEEKGSCRYGPKCQFAHGEDEIRTVSRHPKYKTEICRTFWVSGSCPYGKRCCFIHTELPASGAPPGADGAPPPPNPDGRARSMSTNSDPDVPVSLLARISAKRNQEAAAANNNTTPVNITPPSTGYGFSRPGALRVDTSSLDTSSSKQNKSAYPSFATNGVLLPAPDPPARSPGPVTAGPDFGRQNGLRADVVGYPQQRFPKPTSVNPNVRHSFNGTEFNVPSPMSATGHGPSFAGPAASTVEGGSSIGPRPHGHARSGSAGNWGSFSSLNNHLAPPSPHSHSPSPAAHVSSNAPWPTSELSMNSSRLKDKPWI